MRRVLILLLLALLGCRKARDAEGPLRLGYFPNLTHAQALVGDAEGAFAKALGSRPLEVKRFNAGPSAMEALLAGELDVTYVGTGPVLHAFVRSKGEVRVIAGAASGGAVLVVHGATSAADLVGKKVASPQLGNTQDVALRYWLKSNGIETSIAGGGEVTILPIINPDILTLFKRGDIEGAWVPEPWGARLIAEAGGKILVDERILWPEGRFATTVVAASARALKERRAEVRAILSVHVALTRRARAGEPEFAREANAAFGKITGKPLPEPVLQDAFSRIELVDDPMTEQIHTAARHEAELGFIPSGDVAGLVDASLLEEARAGLGR